MVAPFINTTDKQQRTRNRSLRENLIETIKTINLLSIVMINKCAQNCLSVNESLKTIMSKGQKNVSNPGTRMF